MFSGRRIFQHTLLLTAASLLLRFASMLFQAYLAGRIGADGLGSLQLVLSVSAFASTLGLAGTRVTASCLCAQAHGARSSAQVQHTAAHCLGLVLLTGTLTAIALAAAAPTLAVHALHMPEITEVLYLLAGLTPVGCVNLVLGGYLTAIGAVVKLTAVDAAERVAGLVLSLLLLKLIPPTVSGACFALLGGELLSTCAATAVLFHFYQQNWHGVSGAVASDTGRRVRRMALPLTLSDLLRAALRMFEQLLIPWGFCRAGLSRQTALADYGAISAMVFPLIMFPSAFLYALVDLLIPELAACRAQSRQARLASVTGQCLRAGLLFAGFTTGLLFVLAQPLTQILYHHAQAGRLLRVFSPMAVILYLDALVDGMLKGLSEQVATVRYNTLTSALDVALLLLLLPRWGLTGYLFTFAATHLINFALSLRRLLRASGCPLRPQPALAVLSCTVAASAAGALIPVSGSAWTELVLRACVFSGSFLLFSCLSGTAQHCLPPSLRHSPAGKEL